MPICKAIISKLVTKTSLSTTTCQMKAIPIYYIQIHKLLIVNKVLPFQVPVSWLQTNPPDRVTASTVLRSYQRTPDSSKCALCLGTGPHLLVTAMLISPVLGVSSPSWGRGEIPEVRSGSRPRELSLARSPRADLRLTAWVLVSLSISNATLSVHGKFGCKTFPD